MQDNEQDTDQRTLKAGTLQASDLGRRIEVRGAHEGEVLVGELVAVRHAKRITEVSVRFRYGQDQTFTVELISLEPVALHPAPEAEIPPEGGWVYTPTSDE